MQLTTIEKQDSGLDSTVLKVIWIIFALFMIRALCLHTKCYVEFGNEQRTHLSIFIIEGSTNYAQFPSWLRIFIYRNDTVLLLTYSENRFGQGQWGTKKLVIGNSSPVMLFAMGWIRLRRVHFAIDDNVCVDLPTASLLLNNLCSNWNRRKIWKRKKNQYDRNSRHPLSRKQLKINRNKKTDFHPQTRCALTTGACWPNIVHDY